MRIEVGRRQGQRLAREEHRSAPAAFAARGALRRRHAVGRRAMRADDDAGVGGRHIALGVGWQRPD